MNNSAYALIFTILLKILSLDQTYLVTPALADLPPITHLTVSQVYALVPQLRPIAACESTGDPNGTPRQFNASGTPLWGNDPTTGLPVMKDVGEMQIDYKHFDEAESLGLDVIHSEDDNVYYGYLLYLKKGVQPWYSSQGCWGKAVDNLNAQQRSAIVTSTKL